MINQNNTSLPADPSDEIKNGNVLFGDDFSKSELERWYKQEEEAYYEGDAGNGDVDPWYAYMRYVNQRLGFGFLNSLNANFNDVLVLGPGSGIEVENLYSNRPDIKLHFVEASNNFQKYLHEKYPTSKIVMPQASGDINLESESIDLFIAFSVLHHIPNVSKVFAEAGRLLRAGCYFLVREPCSSMGDWSQPRSATPNERGISRTLLVKYATDNGFEMIGHPTPILFEPLNRIIKKTIGFDCVNHKVLYTLDSLISRALSINDYYWRDSFIKKFGPSSYFYVFKKIR